MTFGSAPGLGAATFTIETWFKRSGLGASTSTGYGGVDAIPLVSKGRAEVDATNQDMNYFLGIRASDNVLVADFEEGASGVSPGLNHPIAGVTPVASGVWYHAAATYNGAKWQLFLNGVMEAELAVGQPPRSDSIQRAALASALDSTGTAAGYFSGVLDEVRIWNYARPAQDIAASMNIEIATAPGLIGRWGLNEGSGTVAVDSSGGGANGTLVNGTTWVVNAVAAVTRGPYLQLGTPSSIAIRWRTDAATNSRVSYGMVQGSLTSVADNLSPTTEHEVRLTGLSPNTRYFYTIGTTTETLASGPDCAFVTSPVAGATQPVRIWVLGDSGEANGNAAAVRDAYTAFNGTRRTDLWLMLGDNAYESGTDAEFQAAVFDMYPAYLRQSVLWPTLGNHDTDQSGNPPPDLPEFKIFTLPGGGEAGGVPSGTESYYSFDFANIHFICLDSQSSDRSPGGPMLTWLRADLASLRQQWTVAYWHHPPYSKGNDDTDVDTQSTEMRQYAVPILEAGGVDLVLCGHSHSYERSLLVNGHYGLSTTLTSAMIRNSGNGREDGTGAYRKPVRTPSANQGTVYVVAGTSGETLYWTGGSTAQANPNPHPAMYLSRLNLGSMVLDVNGSRLDARFLRETGAIDDYFTILKNIPNTAPTVGITSPAENAAFTAPTTITITATASDADGSVKQVDFYAGQTLIGTAVRAPFRVSWNVTTAGTYTLTAAVTDNLGATTNSGPVHVAVNVLSLPAAPTNLTAQTISRTQINLAWADNATNETGYKVYRSTDGRSFATVATLGANVTGYSSTGLSRGKVYYYRVRATNSLGDSANSNTASAKTAN